MLADAKLPDCNIAVKERDYSHRIMGRKRDINRSVKKRPIVCDGKIRMLFLFFSSNKINRRLVL